MCGLSAFCEKMSREVVLSRSLHMVSWFRVHTISPLKRAHSSFKMCDENIILKHSKIAYAIPSLCYFLALLYSFFRNNLLVSTMFLSIFPIFTKLQTEKIALNHENQARSLGFKPHALGACTFYSFRKVLLRMNLSDLQKQLICCIDQSGPYALANAVDRRAIKRRWLAGPCARFKI